MQAITATYKNQFARFQSLIALLVLCIVLSILTDKFFTADNGLNVLRQTAVNICIATGMTLIVLTAGMDLSVGSVLALCGAIAAGLLKNGIKIPSADLFIGFTILGVVLAGILIGAALIIYYTLLLSISEHTGFNIAYGISALATVALIALYSKTFLHTPRLITLVTTLLDLP